MGKLHLTKQGKEMMKDTRNLSEFFRFQVSNFSRFLFLIRSCSAAQPQLWPIFRFKVKRLFLLEVAAIQSYILYVGKYLGLLSSYYKVAGTGK